jgi:CRISPR-associated exonuclease Cas4
MEEPDLLPISALQHWSYCPRQCALIHVEQYFQENVHTLRGRAVHKQVDEPGMELRAGMRIERALPIWSDVLRLIGKADVVEFSADGTPYPVEYKHGSRRKSKRIAECDDLQLAAQAVCLEEMTGKPVPEGAIFYARSKRRREVTMTAELRQRVADAVAEVRRLLATGVVPPPVADERCRACSLLEHCQPFAGTGGMNAMMRANLFDPDR